MSFFGKSRSRIVGLASLGAVVILCLFAAYVLWSRSAAGRLAAEASDWGRSSGERLRDIDRLRRIPGPETTQSLVDIAINDSVPFDSRDAAVTALKGRQDPTISTDLAYLLQPQNGESLRAAVADALTQLPCTVECARSILHYLERMWRGDPNDEDLVADSPPEEVLARLDPELVNSEMTDIRKKREQLVHLLENVLSKNAVPTMKVLRDVYGLGSYHPSGFAIYMVGELHLSQACRDFDLRHLDEMNGEKVASQIEAFKKSVCASR